MLLAECSPKIAPDFRSSGCLPLLGLVSSCLLTFFVLLSLKPSSFILALWSLSEAEVLSQLCCGEAVP